MKMPPLRVRAICLVAALALHAQVQAGVDNPFEMVEVAPL